MINEHNKSNGWRIIAIVFIILFVLETSFFVWSYSLVSKDAERENKCFIDVCGLNLDESLSSEFDNYGYDADTQICYCYKNHEPKKQKYME